MIIGPAGNKAFEAASNGELKAEKLDETMSFMFETRLPQHRTISYSEPRVHGADEKARNPAHRRATRKLRLLRFPAINDPP